MALNTGAEFYLIEPVDPDVLVATVRAVLCLRTSRNATMPLGTGRRSPASTEWFQVLPSVARDKRQNRNPTHA